MEIFPKNVTKNRKKKKKNVIRHRPLRRFRRHENRDETTLCGRSTRAIVRREVRSKYLNSLSFSSS
jgi:hypothetical protein